MTEYQFHCRKMEEQDIPAVVEIEKQLFARPWSKQAFLQALEQDTLYVVVLERDVVVGYCGMYCSFEEGEITNVAIAPERQNQGIGRKMLEYLLEQAYQKGISYIVMELLESKTLKDYIESKGPLSSEITLKIAAQIASALEAAHKAHVVHRDIKPQNIILNQNVNHHCRLYACNGGFICVGLKAYLDFCFCESMLQTITATQNTRIKYHIFSS